MTTIHKSFEEGARIHKNSNLLYGDIASLCKDVA